MKRLLVCFLVILGCGNGGKRTEPTPFTRVLVGELIKFPLTIEQILLDSSVRGVSDGHYQIINASRRIDYFYDWHEYRTDIDSLGRYRLPPNIPFYGVSISLINKAYRMDSVIKVLEREIHLPFKPIQVENINLNTEHIYHIDSPVYTCSPQPGVYVSVRKSSCWRGDFPYVCGRVHYNDPPSSDNPENSLRISISYGLKPDEKERFALGSGAIWKRTD